VNGKSVKQKWFASGTLMANEIGDDEHPADKSIYYHWGLDTGGADRMVDEVTFKVRSFRVKADEGHELWDFGDGSPPVKVQSDAGADPHAKDGYAVTTHRFERPGRYIVSVERTNLRGETGTDRLDVLVEPQ